MSLYYQDVHLIFRYDLTDPRMVRLFQLINSTTSLGAQKLLLTFPFLRFIFPKMTGWTEQKEVNYSSGEIQIWCI